LEVCSATSRRMGGVIGSLHLIASRQNLKRRSRRFHTEPMIRRSELTNIHLHLMVISHVEGDQLTISSLSSRKRISTSSALCGWTLVQRSQRARTRAMRKSCDLSHCPVLSSTAQPKELGSRTIDREDDGSPGRRQHLRLLRRLGQAISAELELGYGRGESCTRP
jgi:hypothetical protein